MTFFYHVVRAYWVLFFPKGKVEKFSFSSGHAALLFSGLLRRFADARSWWHLVMQPRAPDLLTSVPSINSDRAGLTAPADSPSRICIHGLIYTFFPSCQQLVKHLLRRERWGRWYHVSLAISLCVSKTSPLKVQSKMKGRSMGCGSTASGPNSYAPYQYLGPLAWGSCCPVPRTDHFPWCSSLLCSCLWPVGYKWKLVSRKAFP